MILIAIGFSPAHAADDAFKKHFNKSVASRAFKVTVLLNRPDNSLTFDFEETSVGSDKTSFVSFKVKWDKDGERGLKVVKLVEHKAPGGLAFGWHHVVISEAHVIVPALAKVSFVV